MIATRRPASLAINSASRSRAGPDCSVEKLSATSTMVPAPNVRSTRRARRSVHWVRRQSTSLVSRRGIVRESSSQSGRYRNRISQRSSTGRFSNASRPPHRQKRDHQASAAFDQLLVFLERLCLSPSTNRPDRRPARTARRRIRRARSAPYTAARRRFLAARPGSRTAPSPPADRCASDEYGGYTSPVSSGARATCSRPQTSATTRTTAD